MYFVEGRAATGEIVAGDPTANRGTARTPDWGGGSTPLNVAQAPQRPTSTSVFRPTRANGLRVRLQVTPGRAQKVIPALHT